MSTEPRSDPWEEGDWRRYGRREAGGAPPRSPSAPSPLVDAFRGEAAAPKVGALRAALDAALERWWGEGDLPPDALLRDGLLALEAGNELDEAQRTLLLRAATARRRGMVTALAHQTDPERTASVLREFIRIHPPDLTPAELGRLAQESDRAWCAPLAQLLREDGAVAPGLRAPLQPYIEALAPGAGEAGNDGGARRAGEIGDDGAGYRNPPYATGALVEEEPAGAARALRLLVLAVLAGVIVFFALRQWLGSDEVAGMVTLAGGRYTVTNPVSGAAENVDLLPFALDRTEVTNAAYRACVAAGACPRPASDGSATRPTYFDNPLYAQHPVVNVPFTSAQAFCLWAGKRLPSAAEWEAAARYAPFTQRYYTYPWGEGYEPALAVSAGTAGDTLAVGSRSPAGDSPAGAADMAGNAAEWTATASGNDAVVKGGSYRDGAETLRATAAQFVASGHAEPWIGFRCARDGASQ